MKKLLVLVLVILAGILYYIKYPNNSIESKTNQQNVTSLKTQEQPQEMTFKSLFNDKKEIDRLKLLEQDQEISQIEKESKKLITQADKFIEERHLNVNFLVSEKEKTNQELLQHNINKKIRELEEFNNEN